VDLDGSDHNLTSPGEIRTNIQCAAHARLSLAAKVLGSVEFDLFIPPLLPKGD
jgi:hypothetical protein